MSGVGARDRALLTFCAVAVAFAAVDTYVVVLALPDMMGAMGIPVEELQRAAPIVSGFLLGYVAILPLIGRVADLSGQVPVLTLSLVVFTAGSLVTAASYDLGSMVAGRFLQGVGGGGLVPATMSLVAALYPVDRRGLPLGLVSAVQEFGSVLGPLFGALVLSFSTWRGIFAINVAGGLILLVAVSTLARRTGRSSSSPPGATSRSSSSPPGATSRSSSSPPGATSRSSSSPRGTSGRIETPAASAPDSPRPSARSSRLLSRLMAVLLLITTLVTGLITFVQPDELARDVTWGQLFIPYVDGGGRWITPVGIAAIVSFVALVLWCWFAPQALVDLRGWLRAFVAADLVGSGLLAVALGCVVLAFATADPEVAVFSPLGPWLLLGSAVAVGLLVVHLRRAADPVVPRGALRATPAWGSLLVSFLVGWALIAALVDIPLFARTTTERESQLGAALVLLRFLAALPVGAVLGGWLLRRLGAGPLTAVGMVAAGCSFLAMSRWGEDSLESPWATVVLVVGGFGFGLALAPVNAAMLANTDDDAHGLASALVVVARMVGMLVGISALTTIGLRRLYAAQADDPDLSITELGILQEQSVFFGAAVVAFAAAVLALVVFARARTRGMGASDALRSGG